MAATITTMLAAAGLATMPTTQAGLEAEPTEPPAAYTTTRAEQSLLCRLATVNLETGETLVLAAPGSTDACVDDLAVALDGTVWGVIELNVPGLEVHLVQFDAATGEVLSVEPITGNFDEGDLASGGLAFDATGTLYVQLVTDEPGCDNEAVCLYTVDRETATATFVGNPGPDNFFTEMFYLGADCAGSMVTTTSQERANAGSFGDVDAQDAFAPTLAFVDPATGVVSVGSDVAPEGFLLAGLDYSRADGTLYALGTEVINGAETPEGDVGPAAFLASLYTLDPTTGALTLVADLSEPTFDVETLGIAGDCVVPPPPPPTPAPIVLEPTFTG